MRMVRTIPIISIIALSLCAAPAGADQRDVALDGLFSELKATASRDAASQLEAEIWARWTHFSDSAAIDRRMQQGVALVNSGRLRDADAWFSALIDVAPDFAEAWNKRATVRFLLGDHQGSKQDIMQVLELEPRHFGALSGLGMIHLQAGDLQGALQAYEAALAVNPHMDNLRRSIAQLNTILGGQAL